MPYEQKIELKNKYISNYLTELIYTHYQIIGKLEVGIL